jgi:hypothetical protein
MTAEQKYTGKPEGKIALIASTRREGRVAAASEESKYLVQLYASIKERMSKPDIDLAPKPLTFPMLVSPEQ